MVGPVTNLALALRKKHKNAEWINEVIIAGDLVSEAEKEIAQFLKGTWAI